MILQAETDMMVFGCPKGKYYSLQKGRIKKKVLTEYSVVNAFSRAGALGLPGFANYGMLRGNSAGFPWKLIGCLLTNPDLQGLFLCGLAFPEGALIIEGSCVVNNDGNEIGHCHL